MDVLRYLFDKNLLIPAIYIIAILPHSHNCDRVLLAKNINKECLRLMDIGFSVTSDDFIIDFCGIRIKYHQDLKLFFSKFHKAVSGSPKKSVSGHQAHFVIQGRGVYLLSLYRGKVFFYHEHNATHAMTIDDLERIYKAMERYIDKQYKEFTNKEFFGHGTFKVPTWYCI